MEQNSLRDYNSCLAGQEILRKLKNPKAYYGVHKSSSLIFTLRHKSSHPLILHRSILIKILSFVSKLVKLSLPCKSRNQNAVDIQVALTQFIHATCLAHPTILDLIILIPFGDAYELYVFGPN
jgi:hypothetical protein